jgi:hypothetical protein
MKTKIHTLILAILIIVQSNCIAQVISQLPYSNEFEEPEQYAGWQEFQQGEIHHNWAFMNGNDIFNATGCLVAHGYWWDCNPPAVINWMTSTPIDFSSGCYMSLSAKVSEEGSLGAITQLGYGHQIKAFILVGSANPDSATEVIEIANLTGLFSGNDYGGSSIWNDTSNIFIPPTQGIAYLSFKYTGGNPFHVKIDNLNISKDMTATALCETPENTAIQIFPNPSIDYIRFSNLTKDKIFNLRIYSLTGAQVFLQRGINSEKIHLNLPVGFYTYELEDEKFQTSETGKFIISNDQ